MTDQQYTPALGYHRLTPYYDSIIGLMTRENTWRTKLVELVDPKPNDRILDVGCGTGSLARFMASHEPACKVIGLDPDPAVLTIAKHKVNRDGVQVLWKTGFLSADMIRDIGSISKVVSSLVLHQTPIEEEGNILRALHSVIEPGGKFVLADYGLQRTTAMQILFRVTVQTLDGVHDTQPNANGCLPDQIEHAGFDNVTEKAVIPTLTGSISIYQGIG